VNIFYLDKNPKIAAEMHCDKHVVKMITETAQLLSTAHRILDGEVCVVSKMSYSKKNKTYTVKENYKHYHLEGDFYNDDGILVPDKCPIYLAAYKNHPSAVWARLARGNYNWLSDLWGYLGIDYMHRYDKVHKAATLENLFYSPKNIMYKTLLSGVRTAPPQCMPDHYKCNPNSASLDDVVSAYRAYYVGDKAYFAKWTNRSVPNWFTETLQEVA